MKYFLLILIIPVLISCTPAQTYDDGTNGSIAINNNILSDDGTTAFVSGFYANEAPVISKNLNSEKINSVSTTTKTETVSDKKSDSSDKNLTENKTLPKLEVVSTKDNNNKSNNSKDNNTSTKSNPNKTSKDKNSPLFLYPIENISIKKEFSNSGTDKNTGIDFNIGSSEKIYASAGGIVIFAGEKNSLGKSVFIYHDKGYISIYYNLTTISVTKGSSVSSSDTIIGTASSSFHFEIRKQSSSGVEVLNPKNILQKRRK